MPDTRSRIHSTPLESSAGFLAARLAARGSAAANRALVPYGLRVRSFSALAVACSSGPISQKEIAEYMVLDPSQLVQLLDLLEGEGFVTRIPDPADRRARLVTATDSGSEVYRRAQDAVDKAEAHMLDELDLQERETLLELLNRALN